MLEKWKRSRNKDPYGPIKASVIDLANSYFEHSMYEDQALKLRKYLPEALDSFIPKLIQAGVESLDAIAMTCLVYAHKRLIDNEVDETVSSSPLADSTDEFGKSMLELYREHIGTQTDTNRLVKDYDHMIAFFSVYIDNHQTQPRSYRYSVEEALEAVGLAIPKWPDRLII